VSLSTLRTPSCDDDQKISFFSSLPNGVFNLFSSFTVLEVFGQFHQVIQSNKRCNAHWERNLHQYVYRVEPLFDVFVSIEARVLFVRNIDALGWKLYLRDPLSSVIKPSICPVVVAL